MLSLEILLNIIHLLLSRKARLLSHHSAFIPRLCLYPKAMPLSQGHAFIQRPCLYPKAVPVSQGRAFIPRPCLYPKVMPLSKGRAFIPSTFIFATWIVFLFFLNLRFQTPSHLLCLYSWVCVRSGQEPRRPFFSRRGSYESCASAIGPVYV